MCLWSSNIIEKKIHLHSLCFLCFSLSLVLYDWYLNAFLPLLGRQYLIEVKVCFSLQETFRKHSARVYWTICRFNFLLFVAHVTKWFSVNYTWSWVCDSRLAGTHLASVLERGLETVSNCNSHIFLDLIVIYIFDQWVWAWSWNCFKP